MTTHLAIRAHTAHRSGVARLLFALPLVIPGAAGLAQPVEAQTEPEATSRPSAIQPVPPARAQAQQAPADPASGDDVDAYLTRLHDAHRDIRSLTLRVTATTVYTLQGDMQTVRGSLAVLNEQLPREDAPVRRRIRLDFRDRISDGVIRDERKSLVFDGEILVEINHDEEQIIPRRLAPASEILDPLAIDAGVIPIPLGQEPAEIRRVFEASIVPAAEGLEDDGELGYELEPAHLGTLRDWTSTATQLRLEPRPGTKASEIYTLVRAWYDDASLLPVLVVVTTAEENIEVIQLDSHRVNDPAAQTNPRAFITAPDALRQMHPGWTVRPLEEFRETGSTPAETDGDTP